MNIALGEYERSSSQAEPNFMWDLLRIMVTILDATGRILWGEPYKVPERPFATRNVYTVIFAQ